VDTRSPLVQQLRVFNVARLVAILGIVAPWFFQAYLAPTEGSGFFANFTAQAYRESSGQQVGALLLAALVAALIFESLARWGRLRPQVLAYWQLGFDLILISALVYIFGGIESPFSMFYPVLIFLASYFLGRHGAATGFASAALVLYTGLMIGIYLDWNWPPRLATVEPELTYRVTYNVVVALVGFYTVALLAATLAGRTRRAEAELEEKSERLATLRVVYQDVIQSIVSGLITTNLAGAISSANPAALEILGKTSEDLLEQPLSNSGLLSMASWQRFRERCEGMGRVREEVEIVRRGATSAIGFSLTPLKDGQSQTRGYILIFQDLTEKRRLQEQLRVKDRMAAVGQLAAGIAHEIGNPLAAISGSAQMLSSSLPVDSSGVRLVKIILKESQRLDRTIKGFLRFARPGDSSMIRFNIVELLREHFALLSNSEEVLPHHRLELVVDDEPVLMTADADKVTQIFWNLSRNALRAMPEGGSLRLVGQRTEPGWYQLTFTDSGHGMTEEERAKLFEPFQSFFDRGTGIGMAIVYRIVQEHDGHLSVDSAPGRGTRIQVSLPLMPFEQTELALERGP
jgi:two-component system sensor histidine kinase PilS (NtrC family)